MATLQITDLHVQIATENGPKEILKGLSLTIETGETHAIMGPNGSGKSPLASTIAGHPRYEVTSGSITLDGEDVLEMGVDERAQAGLFLAMQYPVEIPGVTMTNFLSTGCGSASSATGPFYCPADESMYFDTAFFETLQTDFGAEGGPLAEEYIVAHEYGHHVQHVTGYLQHSKDGTTGPTSGAVRAELQADCFAGMWAGHAASTVDPESGAPFLKPISQDQLRQAIDAASAVGDDRIQSTHTGRVDPEAFTHGTSEQRMAWFMRGYQSSQQEPDIRQCDTFRASSLDI